MKEWICILVSAGLLAACEQKQTVVSPSVEKKEANTTVQTETDMQKYGTKPRKAAIEATTDATEVETPIEETPAP